MEAEKKYFGGWFMWIVFLMIGAGIVFGGLRSVGMIGQTVVERKIFENSYQKSEADKMARVTYDSQLAILRARLGNHELYNGARIEIQAQIDSINILRRLK